MGQTFDATSLVGRGLSRAVPTDGQVLTFVSATGLYTPTTVTNIAGSAKVTAAAPYTNDGYVTVNVNGVVVKLMTTA